MVGAYLAPDAKLGAMVEVNCETDFVAKNDGLPGLRQRALAELVARHGPARRGGPGRARAWTATERRGRSARSLVRKIGENIAVRRFERIEPSARLAQYLHGARIGVLVEFEGDDAVGKDVAMHVAFAKPRYLSKADVAPEAIALGAQDPRGARPLESGKPPEIVAKMVEGGVNKFLEEVSLLGQPFVKDDKQTVEQMLAAHKARVLGFTLPASWARASRRRQTTSPPKWRPWPRTRR